MVAVIQVCVLNILVFYPFIETDFAADIFAM